MDQAAAAGEAEAEAAAKKATEAAVGGKSDAEAPTAKVQQAENSGASAETAKAAVISLKRPSGGTPASSAKHARKLPVALGTRDGWVSSFACSASLVAYFVL